jgi:hypothetical protein
MHIHVPKPLHGWRAFVGEVGIIVIGVLIALGAEQVVETLHWKSETAKLRESLHGEIQDDQASAAYRVMISACIRQRIARLDDKLAQPGTAWRADPTQGDSDRRWSALPVAFTVPWEFYTSGHWQTALASGALTHMPESERNGYSYAYRAIEDLGSYSKEENVLAAHLQPLAGDRQLDSRERLAFEADLASLDRLNVLLTVYSRKFLEGTRRSGIAARPEDIENAFDQARSDYGACATPLGSTSDALKPGNGAREIKPSKDRAR